MKRWEGKSLTGGVLRLQNKERGRGKESLKLGRTTILAKKIRSLERWRRKKLPASPAAKERKNGGRDGSFTQPPLSRHQENYFKIVVVGRKTKHPGSRKKRLR